MKMIDPHVHMDGVNRANLETMALGGIVALIADAGPLPAPSARSVLEYYERTFSWDVPRASEFLIETYVTIGINMLCIPTDWKEVVAHYPEFLKRDKVVGIGEIGVDPRSFTCPDLNEQEELLRSQLKVAKEYDVAVRLHTPPMDKEKYLEQHIELVDEFKIDKERVIITHADNTILEKIIKFGFIAEITLQPWRGLSIEQATKMIKTVPLDKVMVDSDSALRVSSDVLSVPKVALEMRKNGFTEEEVEKVVYHNPRRVFNLN